MINDEEKYKIISDRINKEIEEFYHVNSVFLVVNTGLLATQLFSGKEKIWIILLGLFFSFIWVVALNSQYNYRNYWINEIKKLEDENGVWKSAPKIFPSVMKLMMLLPIAFIIVWVTAIIYLK